LLYYYFTLYQEKSILQKLDIVPAHIFSPIGLPLPNGLRNFCAAFCALGISQKGLGNKKQAENL